VSGANGLFIETHPIPKDSPSDAESMLNLSKFDNLIKKCSELYKMENK